MAILERIAPREAELIDAIIEMTRQQMQRRYPTGVAPLRGQHAKHHACLQGTFVVREDLPLHLQRGIFSRPKHHYDVWVRYSNAAAVVGADSTVGAGSAAVHGSRGMAIKILDVSGAPLTPTTGALEQDFLFVNHPVFPFANVEDYEAVTRIVTADDDNPARFFAERIRKQADGSPDLADPVTQRALRTLGIVKRIQSPSTSAQPPAFQDPPGCPTDNAYFGGAPFMFGHDSVMRMRVAPIDPPTTDPVDVADPDYLRTALARRFAAAGASEARFAFQAQIRSAADLVDSIDTDIEDASVQWDETHHAFVTLAVLALPAQDVCGPERDASCEALSFSPWNGIAEHRPLGSINRLRRAVYEASATFRLGRSPVRRLAEESQTGRLQRSRPRPS